MYKYLKVIDLIKFINKAKTDPKVPYEDIRKASDELYRLQYKANRVMQRAQQAYSDLLVDPNPSEAIKSEAKIACRLLEEWWGSNSKILTKLKEKLS